MAKTLSISRDGESEAHSKRFIPDPRSNYSSVNGRQILETVQCSPLLARLYSFFKFTLSFKFIFIFREGKGGGKRGRETTTCGCLLHAPDWGAGLQPRHVSDWESNRRPSGSQAGTQSTEPHQPGLGFIHFYFPFYSSPPSP